mgnify:CR=1 FL=1
MIYILNIESSTTNCSISLSFEGKVISIKEDNDEKYTHSTNLHSFIKYVLNESNFNPDELNTEALLTFEDGKILSVDLNLDAKVTGISKEKFNELTKEAKDNCPISGALNCQINLNATLV